MVGLWELMTAKGCQEDISGIQFIWIILGIGTFTACLTWLIFRRGPWWQALVAVLGILTGAASISWGILLGAAR